MPYRPYLCTQLSDAYDVYLELCHRVDRKIQHALGRDTPNWHLRNCCPACFYKLEDEPKQEFSCSISMDGNNSLRRMGADIRKQELRPDSRTLTSDRWLTPDEVNCFKDEVKSSSVRLLDPLRFYTHGFGSRPKGSKITTGIQMTGKMSSQQVLTRA